MKSITTLFHFLQLNNFRRALDEVTGSQSTTTAADSRVDGAAGAAAATPTEHGAGRDALAATAGNAGTWRTGAASPGNARNAAPHPAAAATTTTRFRWLLYFFVWSSFAYSALLKQTRVIGFLSGFVVWGCIMFVLTIS